MASSFFIVRSADICKLILTIVCEIGLNDKINQSLPYRRTCPTCVCDWLLYPFRVFVHHLGFEDLVAYRIKQQSLHLDLLDLPFLQCVLI